MDLFSNDIKIDDFNSAVRLFRESREGFVKLFNTSPVCMSMTTTTLGKRTYVRVNEKFRSTFGFTEEEIIGRTSVEIGILDQPESDRVRQLIAEKGRLQNDYVNRARLRSIFSINSSNFATMRCCSGHGGIGITVFERNSLTRRFRRFVV